jgi:hypothetical protein
MVNDPDGYECMVKVARQTITTWQLRSHCLSWLEEQPSQNFRRIPFLADRKRPLEEKQVRQKMQLQLQKQ